jgi:hypothetical protein
MACRAIVALNTGECPLVVACDGISDDCNPTSYLASIREWIVKTFDRRSLCSRLSGSGSRKPSKIGIGFLPLRDG